METKTTKNDGGNNTPKKLPGTADSLVKEGLEIYKQQQTGRYSTADQFEFALAYAKERIPDGEIHQVAWIHELLEPKIANAQRAASRSGINMIYAFYDGEMLNLNDAPPVMVEPGVHVPLCYATMDDFRCIFERLSNAVDTAEHKQDMWKAIMIHLQTIGLTDGATLSQLADDGNIIHHGKKAA